MKELNIVIVGAGQLGSRHLQSLKKLEINVNIEVLGRTTQSLDIAKHRYNSVPPNNYIKCVKYYTDMNLLSNNIDIAIISTNSDIRKEIIENLVHAKNVKYLILEKVTFPSSNDFIEILSLLKSKKIKAWVNCPHRIYEHNMYLKQSLKTEKNITFQCEGNHWGMACNTVHFIDLICFLTNDEIEYLDNDGLDKCIHLSKREGFVEFTGTLLGKTKKGHLFKLISQDEYLHKDFIFAIETSHKKYYINLSEYTIDFYDKKNNKTLKQSINVPYQSDLTHHIITDILTHGRCNLTPLEESYAFHKPMLEVFQHHLENVTGEKYIYCPIT